MRAESAGRALQRRTSQHARRALLGASACAVLSQLAIALFPGVVARAVDDVVAAAGPDRAVGAALWCAALLALGVAGAALRIGEQQLSWMAGARAVAWVREEVAQGVVAAAPALGRGDLVSRVHRDGDLLWEWVTARVQAAGLVVGIVVTVVSVTALDPLLGLVAVVGLLGSGLVATAFPAAFERRSAEVGAAHGDFSHGLDALVSGPATLRGVGGERGVVAQCAATSAQIAVRSRRLNRLGATWRTAAAAVPLLAGTVGLVVAALGVLEGRLGVGGVVAFSAWMVLLSEYSVGLVSLHQARRLAAASAERLAELLPQPARPGRPAPAGRHLVAAGARGTGPDTLSLAATPGTLSDQRVTDPSTAADLLSGRETPLQGTVTLGGAELAALDPAALAELVRRVPQHPALLGATLGENISLGRTTDPEVVRRACRLAGLLDDVEDFPGGLQTMLGDRGQGLSGGQRQRVGVARALLDRPRVLVLADALSALDDPTAATVRRGLAEAGATTVVLSVRART